MASNLFNLQGKVALITGGNSGLGLGFARGIAKLGGDVEIWGRSKEKNSRAVDELRSYGVYASAREVDVTSHGEIVKGYEALLEEYGRIDTVVVNAGMSPHSYSSLTVTPEEYHSLLNANMHGAFFTLQEGAKAMVKRAEAGEPGGSLIFCGSLSIFQGVPGIASYAAAKGGIGAVIRCMAAELGKYGIRANNIAPGYVKTGFSGRLDSNGIQPVDEWSDLDRLFATKSAIPRPGFPQDFEGIAAYLASDASSWHTGDTIVIDGAARINL